MRARCQSADRVRIEFADTTELVAVCASEVLAGRISVPVGSEAAALANAAPGASCSLELCTPASDGVLALPGRVVAAPAGTPPRVEIELCGAAWRAELEAHLTELLRAGAARAPVPPRDDAAPRDDVEAATACDEAMTGRDEAAAEEDAEDGRAACVPRDGDLALAFQEEATGKALDGRSLATQILEMSHPERIRLAMQGGKAARAAFIRGAQPAYHIYVLRNSRITSAEVCELARLPGISGDAMRMIASSAEHLADPAIRLAVVRNPKTEPAVAQRLVSRLTRPQLQQLARSDDVRAPIRALAQRQLARRTSSG